MPPCQIYGVFRCLLCTTMLMQKNRFRCLRCDVPAPQRQHRSTSAPPCRDLALMPPAVRCYNVHLEHERRLPHPSTSALSSHDLPLMPPAVRCHNIHLVLIFSITGKLTASRRDIIRFQNGVPQRTSVEEENREKRNPEQNRKVRLVNLKSDENILLYEYQNPTDFHDFDVGWEL
jgi:hypothetical protein